MIYADTNILVSLLAGDNCATAAAEWWSAQSVPIGISSWVAAEFHSHMGLRCRKKEITARQASAFAAAFDEMVSTNLTLLKSSDNAMLRASTWLRTPDCALQTSDALHLAIALENEAAAIATFDHRFARGIEKLRVAGLKVIALPFANAPQGARQKSADYNVTERDVARAARAARSRKAVERAGVPRLTVRG